MTISWSWHNGALALLFALALGLALTTPDPAPPPLPENGEHVQRLRYRTCPECHSLAELPATHTQGDARLGGAYEKCYLCHG